MVWELVLSPPKLGAFLLRSPVLLLCLYFGVSQLSERCDAVEAASLRWSELSENIPINNGCGFMVKNTSDGGGVYSVHVRPTPITL